MKLIAMTQRKLKTVVIVQSVIVTILGLALYSDYLHNVYLRIFVDGLIQKYVAEYSAIIGMSSGMLVAVAVTLVRQRGIQRHAVKPQSPVSVDLSKTRVQDPLRAENLLPDKNASLPPPAIVTRTQPSLLTAEDETIQSTLLAIRDFRRRESRSQIRSRPTRQ